MKIKKPSKPRRKQQSFEFIGLVVAEEYKEADPEDAPLLTAAYLDLTTHHFVVVENWGEDCVLVHGTNERTTKDIERHAAALSNG